MAPSHYLNQCWFIVNVTQGNLYPRDRNWNSIFSIEQVEFETVACKKVPHSSGLQCNKTARLLVVPWRGIGDSYLPEQGMTQCADIIIMVDSGLAPSQWETALHCNDVSHWLGASLESALIMHHYISKRFFLLCCSHRPLKSRDKNLSWCIRNLTLVILMMKLVSIGDKVDVPPLKKNLALEMFTGDQEWPRCQLYHHLCGQWL